MAKFNWKAIVGSVAPTLATALGGPLAGMAVKTIATQVLGKSDATENEVSVAMQNADPQTLLKLKEVDLEFRKAMLDAGVKLEELAAADRANSRDREIKTGDSWTPRVIAGVVVIGWFLIQWFLLEHVVPAEMIPIVMRTLGTLDMALGLVLGYYFGSSASSHRKDDALSEIAKMP